ncbi:hypothetical protein C0995_009446 [Termitomyces sp. Mi166|nr:hypothetical protein C0995_009446 [Termitomyces sp. Mi166\
MNNKNQTPSPVPSSKLPKFLRTSTSNRAETSTTSVGSTNDDASSKSRKSRFLPRRSADVAPPPDNEPPIIVEPVAIPRPRRTLSPSPSPSPSSPSTSPQRLSLYASTSGTSSSRLTDLPTRLSGWFSHTFSTSTTDLSLPSLLASTSSASFTPRDVSPGTSPKRSVGASALLAAAKHGKGHLDKAMRYLLDSDAMPDRCIDPIWILGVKHPGWEPPPPPSLAPSSSTKSLRSSVSSTSDQGSHAKPGVVQWPPVFYADFTSRVWLTYRSHFTPIRDVRLGDLDPIGLDCGSLVSVSASGSKTNANTRERKDKEKERGGDKDKDREEGSSSPVIGRRPWAWASGAGGSVEKGWTSDAGWGCMLRTGQSLLANALIHLHLGRDWRRPPHPIPTADYATYVQILTWFLDTPEAPFSVHRMALAGKELGKDVGQWFGPSTAAGAIK